MTAVATSSQLSDAAAALLIERTWLRTHGLTPRARVHHLSVLGADPLWMLTAPIPATARALAKTGLTMDDIDLIEICSRRSPRWCWPGSPRPMPTRRG